MIRPFAGKMRGVRVMPDPLSILLNPFDEGGTTYGYVIVPGEDSPAIYDGAEWHSILDTEDGWESKSSEILLDQLTKIQQSIPLDPAYERLATLVMADAL
jgi:hypothetical protein